MDVRRYGHAKMFDDSIKNLFEKQTNPNEDIFKAATKIFKEVKIANCDELSW